MEKCSVVIMPEELKVEIDRGNTILEAAQKAGIPVKASCGGQGTCGKCTVKVISGEFSGGDGNIKPALKEDGYILACTASVLSDLVVEIPEEFRLHAHQVLLDDSKEGILQEKTIECLADYEKTPLAKKYRVTMSEPNLVENASDSSRLMTELKAVCGLEKITMSNYLLVQLPNLLRDAGWDVTVTLLLKDDSAEIIRISSGDDQKPPYGVAVDIGTTTVVVALVDLESGKILNQSGTYNRQANYGDDVISRIVFADEENGLEPLQKVIIETVNDLLSEVYEESSVDSDEVSCMMVAANTTMTHLFMGINPKYIRLEPYIPVAQVFPEIKGKELGININPLGEIYNLPAVASYVGGDIVSGTLLNSIDKKEELILFVDIGTNGEMVLGNSDWLMCCACSAGPAFEGGGIEFGMRAMSGAIERINVSDDYEVSYVTIGAEKPVGICGSGLIDCLSTLRMAGIINRSGIIQKVDNKRYREGENGAEFVIVWADESGIDKDIIICDSDIQNLIRAKGAVFAGIRVMLKMMDLPIEAIEKILIAGGFGNYLNLSDSIRIGLLPDIPQEKYEFIGNSSLKGAHMALLSRSAYNHSLDLARSMTYLELSLGNDFMDEYVSAMFLPHTDLSLFPSVSD